MKREAWGVTPHPSRLTLVPRQPAQVKEGDCGGSCNVERVNRWVHRDLEPERSLLQCGFREPAAFIADGQDGSRRKTRNGSNPAATFLRWLRCHQRATVLSEKADIRESEDRQRQQRAGGCTNDLGIERIC